MKSQNLLLFLSQILLFIFCTFSIPTAEVPISFPRALDEASITPDSLNNILDGSLIIGNGDLNALVYIRNESIIMNITKNDVWDSRLDTSNDPPIPTLGLIKQLAKSGIAFPLSNNNSGYVLPEGQIWKAVDSYHSRPYPCPRQCARIVIPKEMEEKSKIIKRGEIDLYRAVARIWETVRDSFPDEYRVLANRNTLLIKTPGKLNLLAVESNGLPLAETGNSNGIVWLKQRIPGDLDWPGMEFAVAAITKGQWKVVAVVSSFESGNVIKSATALATETIEMNTGTLITNHESVWHKFWSKSGIELSSLLLQRNWYRSLYFLRCFSKPGVQSVGLFAGLLSDTPAWHGDYHTNYNIQQTYWAALPANHPELIEPYERLIFEYLPRSKWLANQVFSMEGAYYPHVLYANEIPNPLKCKNRNGRQYFHHTWGMTIGVTGFTVQPLWWRYKYDPNPERLKDTVYPVLREAAIFYTEFIRQSQEDGKVHLGPSVSPEHWGWTKHLERNYNCTFDIAMIRYILKAAIEAAQTLKQDQNLVDRFQSALQQLPDYPVYENGVPTVVDVEGAPPIEYNIPVPSTPVFPGDVVSWWSGEKTKQIFKHTIDQLRWNGNNATIMLAIARARLGLPETQEWLENEIRRRSRTNGTLSLNRLIPYQRFNDFGHYTEQFGVGLAISELLLQSVDDIIRVFPALSPGTQASFNNLRTQGGFLVSAKGSFDAVEELQILSLYGDTLRLLSPWQTIQATREKNLPFRTIEQDSRGIIKIPTKMGDKWNFRGK